MPISNGFAGREVIVSQGGTPIAGIRTKTVTFEGEPIDTTTDENDGWRTLIPVYGTRGLTISVDGVTKSHQLKTAALTQAVLFDLVIEWPDGYTIEGNFGLASYAETGPYDDAMTFTCEFRSNGPVTYEEPIS